MKIDGSLLRQQEFSDSRSGDKYNENESKEVQIDEG